MSCMFIPFFMLCCDMLTRYFDYIAASCCLQTTHCSNCFMFICHGFVRWTFIAYYRIITRAYNTLKGTIIIIIVISNRNIGSHINRIRNMEMNLKKTAVTFRSYTMYHRYSFHWLQMMCTLSGWSEHACALHRHKTNLRIESNIEEGAQVLKMRASF